MKKFNLTKEPWIRVVDLDGKFQMKSLTEVLSEAHAIRELAGELPTQDLAILRLLLGILYPIYTRKDANGNLLDEYSDMLQVWAELWAKGRFSQEVAQYLGTHAERFWLIHPDLPFWQVPVFNDGDKAVNRDGDNIRPFFRPEEAKGGGVKYKENGLLKIAGDAMGSNLFGIRRDIPEMTFDEAARWLVYYNNFAVSVAGGRGNKKDGLKVIGYRQPYTAYLSHVTMRGNNLFETLMLNLVLEDNDAPWRDTPAWWEIPHPFENDRAGNNIDEIELAKPKGITEYMSTLYRYLRLVPNDSFDAVEGVVLWSGVWYTDEMFMSVEKMALWKKLKDGGIVPKGPNTLPPQLWRDFTALLVTGSDDTVAPGVLTWLNKLAEEGGLTLPRLRLSVDGVMYKTGTAKEGEYSDVLSVNTTILANLSEFWCSRIPIELAKTDKKVRAYSYFVKDIRMSQGKSEVKLDEITPYVESVYRKLDIPFREWLRELSDDLEDMEAKCDEWQSLVDKVLRREADELVATTGSSAFIGREYKVKNKPVLFNTPIAYNKFISALVEEGKK